MLSWDLFGEPFAENRNFCLPLKRHRKSCKFPKAYYYYYYYYDCASRYRFWKTTTTTQGTTTTTVDKQYSCETGWDVNGNTGSYQVNWGDDADACYQLCAADSLCACSVLATDVSGGTCMLKSDCSAASNVGGTTRVMCSSTVDCSWWNCP